jgi:hypothetical protein
MARSATDAMWATLAGQTGSPDVPFEPGTLAGLPAPARRFLGRCLPGGVPLTTAVVLEMEGEIKLGKRWMPFRADQVLRAGVGFVWRPVVGRSIVRFVGSDVLGPGAARMAFKLHGLIPVVRASGPAIARSAAGRLAGETVAWLPQALTPQAGARWRGVDGERAIVTLVAAAETIDVEVTVAADGRLDSLSLQRWKDSAEPPGFEPFGGRVEAEHVTDDGVRIAGGGIVGWGWGSPAWEEGEFFHYRITSYRPVRTGSRPGSG